MSRLSHLLELSEDEFELFAYDEGIHPHELMMAIDYEARKETTMPDIALIALVQEMEGEGITVHVMAKALRDSGYSREDVYSVMEYFGYLVTKQYFLELPALYVSDNPEKMYTGTNANDLVIWVNNNPNPKYQA